MAIEFALNKTTKSSSLSIIMIMFSDKLISALIIKHILHEPKSSQQTNIPWIANMALNTTKMWKWLINVNFIKLNQVKFCQIHMILTCNIYESYSYFNA